MQEETLTYINIIKNWKQQADIKKITDVLKRLQAEKLKHDNLIEKATQCMSLFHKQICQAQHIPQEWFQIVKAIKRQLNKITQQMKKKSAKRPVLQKNNSVVIDYPSSLFQNKTQSQKSIMKYLYKSFVNNFDKNIMSEKIVPFLEQLFLYLKQQIKDVLQLTKKVQKICSCLNRQSSKQAKIQMLQGKKNIKYVINNTQEAFESQQQKQSRKKAMQQQVKASDTQFYKNMKKNINKDASQECRFCRKPTAYCEDMKQTRAADQPMTRFMNCNTCGKKWRD